jgi:stearoyl-CoA desaturase (delta-9 desaturase)
MLYLHRSLSHGSVRLAAPARLVARTFLWMFTGIRPREWAAVHRYHHATVDTPADPHSPAVRGVWRVFFTNANLYRRQVRMGVPARFQRGLGRDRLDRLVFDHTRTGLLVGVSAMTALLGIAAGLVAFALHGIIYIQSNAAVNAFCHHWGKQPNVNSATNLRFLALFTLGEALHNNHHERPAAARLDWQPGTIDPGWWLISALHRLQLVQLPRRVTVPAGEKAREG